jgi:hypothetical protein
MVNHRILSAEAAAVVVLDHQQAEAAAVAASVHPQDMEEVQTQAATGVDQMMALLVVLVVT